METESNLELEDDATNQDIALQGQKVKGQSGKRRGRPKGSQNLKTLILRELKMRVTIKEDGKTKKVTMLEAIMKRFVETAMKGDTIAIDMLANRPHIHNEVIDFSPDFGELKRNIVESEIDDIEH